MLEYWCPPARDTFPFEFEMRYPPALVSLVLIAISVLNVRAEELTIFPSKIRLTGRQAQQRLPPALCRGGAQFAFRRVDVIRRRHGSRVSRLGMSWKRSNQRGRATLADDCMIPLWPALQVGAMYRNQGPGRDSSREVDIGPRE